MALAYWHVGRIAFTKWHLGHVALVQENNIVSFDPWFKLFGLLDSYLKEVQPNQTKPNLTLPNLT